MLILILYQDELLVSIASATSNHNSKQMTKNRTQKIFDKIDNPELEPKASVNVIQTGALIHNFSLPTLNQLKKFTKNFQRIVHENEDFVAYVDNITDKTHIENNSDFTFTNLRTALSHLGHEDAYKAIYYKSLAHYYQQKYCGKCSQPLQRQEHNKFLYCHNCATEIYPHIAPSIIVRITRDNEILLARNVNFAKNIWALIAGYVEIGESLEEAAHREVQEEVGIKIKNLKYFGSQPWPFGGISLMVGFTAEYDSGEITLQEDEIAEAGFFTKDNLPGLPSSKVSIAHKMIDNFILN